MSINNKIAKISDNEHPYINGRSEPTARIVRTILNDGIRLPNNDNGITVYCQFYARLDDGNGGYTYKPIKVDDASKYSYINAQVQGFWNAINDPLYPNEGFVNEINLMFRNLLLQETITADPAFFGGDNFQIYEPA